MDSYKFSISENELVALPSGALWWPSQSLLCVSDLHFGKSNRLARKGQSWFPPYENQDTLLRLEKDLKTTKARMIICLGDSFDDNEGDRFLPKDEILWMQKMQEGKEWIWISGNHDPSPKALGGSFIQSIEIGEINFQIKTNKKWTEYKRKIKFKNYKSSKILSISIKQNEIFIANCSLMPKSTIFGFRKDIFQHGL